MANDYSVEVCRELEERFRRTEVCRPMRLRRYEPGTELTYQVQGFAGADTADVHLTIERFVGGGFAGQVYRVKILAMDGAPIAGLEVGGSYAMKILIPPSRFSCLFRDVLYWVGFQGPFQLQVNPAAARAGALWQKVIRRAAGIQFGDERAVVDIYGTFVDEQLGSCGELSEWVDGRTWRLEVDDRMDLLRRWNRGRLAPGQTQPPASLLGSPEYRAKKVFLREFVALLHEVGAHEFARQYEWSTCKSQPNCLKRRETGDDPAAGLVAVDFRAGLTLLPFLPMSPGDVKLILQGIGRGSLVQFDRGSLHRLDRFVAAHRGAFADMEGILAQLREAEHAYRASVPDLTHHHLRLFYSGALWATIFDRAVAGWQTRGLLEERHAETLRRRRVFTLAFFLLGCLPWLGRMLQRSWGRPDWREHYVRMASSFSYLRRAWRAWTIEKLMGWHRAGRLAAGRTRRVAEQPWRFWGHWPLALLPAGLHRFLTDASFAREKLAYLFIRPVRLYFNAALREQWLRDMLAEGQQKHMLSADDARTIVGQLGEPFIQKYLKSLAVHVCTLPVTQVVSVSLAVLYVLAHPEMPRAQAWGVGLGIVALFQVLPLSPGSLTRGLYVVYLVVRERNFRDYHIAVFLGFFKYVGYLAFPIQMTYRYPALARFMAAHWATQGAHVVPVFGEGGALLEHWVFRLFYNWPLTIRGRMRRRAQARASQPVRRWHVGACVLVGAALCGLVNYYHLNAAGRFPTLQEYAWLTILLPLLGGVVVTLGSGGAGFGRRIAAAALCGVLTAGAATLVSAWIAQAHPAAETYALAVQGVWRVFIFGILATAGAGLTELALPEPRAWAYAARPESSLYSPPAPK
jgi:hypothetical protein